MGKNDLFKCHLKKYLSEKMVIKIIYVVTDIPSLFLSVNYLDGHCSIVYLMKALKLDLSCLDYSLDLGLDLSLSTNRAQSR